jgi:hypothetical protein
MIVLLGILDCCCTRLIAFLSVYPPLLRSKRVRWRQKAFIPVERFILAQTPFYWYKAVYNGPKAFVPVQLFIHLLHSDSRPLAVVVIIQQSVHTAFLSKWWDVTTSVSCPSGASGWIYQVPEPLRTFNAHPSLLSPSSPFHDPSLCSVCFSPVTITPNS